MLTQSGTPQTRRPPLRDVRLARGLTLREVARLSGVEPGHLSRIERGQRPLSVDVLARLARVLGLPELAKLLRPYVGEGER